MTPNRDNQAFSQLSAADGAALDAMLEAASRGDSSAYQKAADTESGRRVSGVLGVLNAFHADEPADDLVARTMARIAVSSAVGSSAPGVAATATANLSDFDLLDELLESKATGHMEAARAAATTDRGRRVTRWLDLIDLIPAAAPANDLVARTMSRINTQARREAVVARIDDHRPAAGDHEAVPAIAFRWRELISVAAMLMIAVSLLWPIMARTRSDAMRVACATNLATTAVGLGHYAADNQHVLPRYATTAGSVWWNVGRPAQAGRVESNSAHLYKLRREGYTSVTNLNCPTNGEAPQQLAISAFDWPNARAISYSYQNQYTPEPTSVRGAGDLVVLADKNPLFRPADADGHGADALSFDASRALDEPGARHRQPGQNVLVMDGSVRWTSTPVLKAGGDNFYTAANVTTYRGTETPAGKSDSFVVP